MKYVLKMMNKEKFIITEQEFRQIANANGKVYIKSCDSIINTNMIECAYSEDKTDDVEETKNQQIGILHDGTAVRKEYGRWVVDREKYNVNGYELELEYPNPQEYPEIARECVPTYKQFEKLKHLALPERLKAILGYEILPAKRIKTDKK